jgi:hypothetical protein
MASTTPPSTRSATTSNAIHDGLPDAVAVLDASMRSDSELT